VELKPVNLKADLSFSIVNAENVPHGLSVEVEKAVVGKVHRVAVRALAQGGGSLASEYSVCLLTNHPQQPIVRIPIFILH